MAKYSKLASNPFLWEAFYYQKKDKQPSYKATINNKKYKVLFLDTKKGKPYFAECLTPNEDLGYFANAEQAKKKCEKHATEKPFGRF